MPIVNFPVHDLNQARAVMELVKANPDLAESTVRYMGEALDKVEKEEVSRKKSWEGLTQRQREIMEIMKSHTIKIIVLAPHFTTTSLSIFVPRVSFYQRYGMKKPVQLKLTMNDVQSLKSKGMLNLSEQPEPQYEGDTCEFEYKLYGLSPLASGLIRDMVG